MDFTNVIHTRPMQEHYEREHANFHQLNLLKGYFNEMLPNKSITPEMGDEEQAEVRQFWHDRRFAVGLIAMVCLYKRLPLEALVNLFKHEAAQYVASIAEALTKGGWIGWDSRREEFVTSVLPTALHEAVFNKRYPMPMLCRPNTLFTDRDSPYLTEERSQSVLGDYNGQTTNLATLNALNAIPLKLNQDVIKGAPDPFKDDDKYRRDSAEVMGKLGDQNFHITWQFDFRGRVYARGYHVNPQGSDWHKHTIQFGD